MLLCKPCSTLLPVKLTHLEAWLTIYDGPSQRFQGNEEAIRYRPDLPRIPKKQIEDEVSTVAIVTLLCCFGRGGNV
jgi:hypothetical protein